MDILFFLIPFSVVLALAIVGVLAWAVAAGQFEDVESEGHRIFVESPWGTGSIVALLRRWATSMRLGLIHVNMQARPTVHSRAYRIRLT